MRPAMFVATGAVVVVLAGCGGSGGSGRSASTGSSAEAPSARPAAAQQAATVDQPAPVAVNSCPDIAAQLSSVLNVPVADKELAEHLGDNGRYRCGYELPTRPRNGVTPFFNVVFDNGVTWANEIAGVATEPVASMSGLGDHAVLADASGDGEPAAVFSEKGGIVLQVWMSGASEDPDSELSDALAVTQVIWQNVP